MTISWKMMPADRLAVGRRKVALLAYEGQCLYEFASAAEVLRDRSEVFGEDWYELHVCALEPGTLRSEAGTLIEAREGLDTLLCADMVIVAGWPMAEAPPEALCQALRDAHARGARIVSICTGAFPVAAAGLLDGRRATTHWRYAETLARTHPRVIVDPNALYIDEGDVVTSAGSSAGVDMLLHLIRRDYGLACSNAVAREMVSAPHRDGGQAQFIESRVLDVAEAPLAKVLDFVRGNLDRQHQVHELAGRARMSPRTFFRRFKETTGLTPYEWLLHERLRVAKALLEESQFSIDEIAFRTGFGAADTFRHHFQRVVRTTPSEYRRTFRVSSVASCIRTCLAVDGIDECRRVG